MPKSLEGASGIQHPLVAFFSFRSLTTRAIKVARCHNKTLRRQSKILIPAGLLVHIFWLCTNCDSKSPNCDSTFQGARLRAHKSHFISLEAMHWRVCFSDINLFFLSTGRCRKKKNHRQKKLWYLMCHMGRQTAKQKKYQWEINLRVLVWETVCYDANTKVSRTQTVSLWKTLRGDVRCSGSKLQTVQGGGGMAEAMWA